MNNPADIVTIEGEIVNRDVSGLTPVEQMARAKSLRPKAFNKTKKERRLNVTKIMNEYGYNPIVTQILLATNQWRLLGLKGPVTAHEMNSAAQFLTSLSVPTLKAVDYINPDEEMKQIPIYVDKRGTPDIKNIAKPVDPTDVPCFIEGIEDE